MATHYYQVVDFDAQEEFFTSKARAIKRVKELIAEAKEGNWDVSMIDFVQFDLAKMPKRKLVLSLLHRVQFMVNKISLDISRYA